MTTVLCLFVPTEREKNIYKKEGKIKKKHSSHLPYKVIWMNITVDGHVLPD